jgi:CheY-like chemotaxis protein/two-component sensor histidine kinase
MSEKILVIEDNHQVRENIIEILESEKYIMFQAENGEIGIEIARKNQPDLILCDIMMPEMDGYQVLAELRRNILTTNIPFIFLTAKDTRDDMRKGMQMGADDYISKPFTIEELIQAVQIRLNRIREFKRKSEQKLNELTLNLGAPIAKEISEPLRAIIGFSSMILTENSQMPKNEIVEFVSLVYDAGMRLNRIVLKTLLFYRLESLSVQNGDLLEIHEMSTSNVKKVTEDVCKEIAANYNRLDDIKLSLEDTSIKIPEQFYRDLIKEMIENAILYSPKNSMIKVVSGIENKKMFISIIDEGIGMSDEQVAEIGAYMQFNKDLYNQSGIGLGITIAKRIIKLFDGTFSINSKHGMGTNVKITLNVI